MLVFENILHKKYWKKCCNTLDQKVLLFFDMLFLLHQYCDINNSEFIISTNY